jgi:hypothetical protein
VLPYEEYGISEPNLSARLSVIFGLFGVALAPAAVYLAMRLEQVSLLMAVMGIAACCPVLGLVALQLAKRARFRRSISLGRMDGAKMAGFGRLLGTLSLALGLGACVALAVYAFMSSR